MGQEVRTGVAQWRVLERFLPPEWVAALRALPQEQGRQVQEVRLRVDWPVGVSLSMGERYLAADGLTVLRTPRTYVCDAERLERIFLAFCEDSVYAHEWALSQGYVSAPGGLRIGVAGTAVTEGGAVRAVRQITSLCVRLPRRLRGCAAELEGFLFSGGRLLNTLLVGEPSSGKTTLLRDVASRLSTRGFSVAVVDERGELSGAGDLAGCDVLRGYPKAVGIRQAVRCLAPRVVVFDELGDEAEARAVADCARQGVAVVASLHGYELEELGRRPLSRMLARRQVFDRWVLLAGRDSPGQWRGCYTTEVREDAVDWVSVDSDGGSGDGVLCCRPLAGAGALSDPRRELFAYAAGAAGVYRQPDDAAVAAVGGGGWLR